MCHFLGCMLCFGQSAFFRFNHPEEAFRMKSMVPQGGSVSTGDYRLCPGTVWSCTYDSIQDFTVFSACFHWAVLFKTSYQGFPSCTNGVDKNTVTFCHMNNKALKDHFPPEVLVSAEWMGQIVAQPNRWAVRWSSRAVYVTGGCWHRS